MAVSNVKKPRPNVEMMVLEAIEFHAEKKGSSVQAIKKYISTNFTVDQQKLAPHLKKFLQTSVENGVLQQTTGKGMTGKFKIIPLSIIPKKTAKVKPTEVPEKPKAKVKPITKTTKEPPKVRVPKAKTGKAPNLVTKSPMLPKASKSMNRPPRVYKATADKTKKLEQSVTEKPNKATRKNRKPSTPGLPKVAAKNSKKVTKSATADSSIGPSASTPYKPPKRNTTRATVSTKAAKKTPKGKASSRSTKPSPQIMAIPEVSDESTEDNVPTELFGSPILPQEPLESSGSGSGSETDVSSYSCDANSTVKQFESKKVKSYRSKPNSTPASL